LSYTSHTRSDNTTLSLHYALPISQQRGFCSRARLKISKGQVVFFEKITQKISTFKPLPIFILSVLFSLPKARLSKNKIFIESGLDRKSTRLNSSHVSISYAVFCLK